MFDGVGLGKRSSVNEITLVYGEDYLEHAIHFMAQSPGNYDESIVHIIISILYGTRLSIALSFELTRD